jgi:hypothetical protein
MIHKKLCCIFGVGLEPVLGTSKPKTVTPGIHVEHESLSADAIDMVGQHDLQVANSRFLKIVTTRVTVQSAASLLCHTDDVACFVEQ